MNSMLIKGHVVKVPISHLSCQDGQVWYIPHHGVYHPRKKLRVVFNCAASFRGTSLNDELLQGLDVTNSLIGVLTKFAEFEEKIKAKDITWTSELSISIRRHELRYMSKLVN